MTDDSSPAFHEHLQGPLVKVEELDLVEVDPPTLVRSQNEDSFT